MNKIKKIKSETIFIIVLVIFGILLSLNLYNNDNIKETNSTIETKEKVYIIPYPWKLYFNQDNGHLTMELNDLVNK